MIELESAIAEMKTARTLMEAAVADYFDPMVGEVDSFELAHYAADALKLPTKLPLWVQDIAIDVALAFEDLQ